jgi:Flp pilus assembly pilin Flp
MSTPEGRMFYIRALLKAESGQDLVEYGLLAAFIAISAVATLRLIEPLVLAIWNVIQAAIETV